MFKPTMSRLTHVVMSFPREKFADASRLIGEFTSFDEACNYAYEIRENKMATKDYLIVISRIDSCKC